VDAHGEEVKKSGEEKSGKKGRVFEEQMIPPNKLPPAQRADSRLSKAAEIHERSVQRLKILFEYQATEACIQQGESEHVARLIEITRDTIVRAERILKKDQ